MVKYHEKDYGNVVVNGLRDFLWERNSAENTIDNYCRTNGIIKGAIISVRNDSPIDRTIIGRNMKKLAERLGIAS